MNDVKINNQPKILETFDKTVDHTATYVVLLLLFLTLVVSIVIAIFLTGCKERSLFIFREMDMVAVTGGRRKKVVGGILMIFFIMYIILIWSGYLVNYLLYNERRESSETRNPLLNKNLPSSYEVEIIAYGSKVKESNAPFLIYDANKGEKADANPDDLCEYYQGEIDLHRSTQEIVQVSQYFRTAKEASMECKRSRLNEFSDEYTIKLKFKDLEESKITQEFMNIQLNTDHTFAFHFFKWKFRSVWEYGFNEMPVAFSEMEGIMSPQKVVNSNKNITKAFKGPDPTYLSISLIPTHYINEVEATNHDGYRVHLEKFWRGSTVNKRTLVNRYLATGKELKGMTVHFEINKSEMFFQVRIEKVKSILEVLAFMLGFLAGFILLVRAIKYYLLKETYFLELEKTCEQYYGRHNELKYEEDDDITNIELLKLDRTRFKTRASRDGVVGESADLTNRQSVIQLDKSDLNDEEEKDLRNLAI